MNNVKFIRNRLYDLVSIADNSTAIIQNNILTENYISSAVYYISSYSTIQLNDVEIIQNNLIKILLDMSHSSSAKFINNTIDGNNYVDRIFFADSSYRGIHTIRITTHFPQLISVVECKVSFESMRVLENNVLRGMIYIENIEI